MSKEGGPNRSTIIDAIVLAFSHSKMKEIVGTDALRTVVSGQYPDFYRDGVLHLEPLWSLLAEQPGFEIPDAKPPFCLLNTWSKHLKVEVELPAALSELTATEIMAHASHCAVPKSKRVALFSEDRKRGSNTSSIDYVNEMTTPPPPTKEAPTRKPKVEAALAAVAVAGIAFGGFTVFKYFSSPGFKEVNIGDIGSSIPVDRTKRLGSDLTLTVNDDAWFETPEAYRQKGLEEALTSLEDDGIKGIVVLDKQGKIRASVQWGGTPRTPMVRFH